MVYQQKFLGEMLMKLLLELDAVDVSEIEDVERKQNIKQMRKDGIKLIQGYLKPIDALKK
jgi:EAL domain-containing protein (putative c-di-GMP-specific phosphodiesterase class I)